MGSHQRWVSIAEIEGTWKLIEAKVLVYILFTTFVKYIQDSYICMSILCSQTWCCLLVMIEESSYLKRKIVGNIRATGLSFISPKAPNVFIILTNSSSQSLKEGEEGTNRSRKFWKQLYIEEKITNWAYYGLKRCCQREFTKGKTWWVFGK